MVCIQFFTSPNYWGYWGYKSLTDIPKKVHLATPASCHNGFNPILFVGESPRCPRQLCSALPPLPPPPEHGSQQVKPGTQRGKANLSWLMVIYIIHKHCLPNQISCWSLIQMVVNMDLLILLFMG